MRSLQVLAALLARTTVLQVLVGLLALITGQAQTCGNHSETTQHSLTTPDGRSRFYLKYKPSGITTTSSYPLVIELHGQFACASTLYSFTGWKLAAEQNDFILVTPQGVSRSWNAGRCCGEPREAQLNVDDVSFLRTVATHVLAAEPGIDPMRVYFAGHSTGCMMAQRMAIEASELVAAVACHSGMLMAPPSSPAFDSITTPSDYAPVPVMEIHGQMDETVSFDYDTVFGVPFWPGALRNLGWWQQLNGCPTASPTTTSYGSYSIHLHTGCTDGSQAVLVDIPLAGHMPFLSYEPYVNTTQLAWDFVQQRRKRGGGASAPKGASFAEEGAPPLRPEHKCRWSTAPMQSSARTPERRTPSSAPEKIAAHTAPPGANCVPDVGDAPAV